MARNPYQMDPFLQQGFSNLTKALIGDAETDYQVARTNRVNELLPLEKQQLEAQIAGSNANAAAARALKTLRDAQTLTENQLRDPLVQNEIANAQATLALAAERNASASANTALANQRNQLTPAMVASENALATSRNADAGAATALEKSRLADAMLTTQTTQPTVDKINAEANAASSLAAERDASAAQTTALTTPKVNQTNAETEAATALANERNTSAELNTAKAESERRIVLNKGQTIVTTNDQGERETYTAPENVTVTLEPGEEATVFMADGTEKKIKGPPIAKSNKPGDSKTALETVDAQINAFIEAEDYASVPQSVVRKMRSKLTSGTKDMDGKAAAEAIQQQLSQAYDGQNVVVLQDGLVDGPAFGVPAYILNFIMEAMQNGRTPSADAIAKEYGFSKAQAQAILDFTKG